jgi:hypothetical protein
MSNLSGKRRLIIAICVSVLLFGSLVGMVGSVRTWALWGIPQEHLDFADLRIVAGGSESASEGFDPLVENPRDPWGRPMNYPRVWTWLRFVGFGQQHVGPVGIAMAFVFLIGVVIAVPKSDGVGTALTMAALLSPAVMLGLERANIDLLMFFLVAVSLAMLRRSETIAFVAVMLGFVLKIFPLFGLVVFASSRNIRFWLITGGTVVVGYILLIGADLALISKATLMGDKLSYGVNVFWQKASSVNPQIGTLLKYASYLAVIGVFLFCLRAIWVAKKPAPYDEATDAFRVGASIYVCSFVLGNNWDYRLMFLLLVVPGLRTWMWSADRQLRLASRGMTIALFISLWHLPLDAGLDALPGGNYVGFALDEFANWSLFSGLSWLLVRTLDVTEIGERLGLRSRESVVVS